jgi:hypothetical protein
MAPEIFHETVALHCMSSVLGRNISFERGAKTVYPNIWAVILGPSGTSKKSTALDYGHSMLTQVASEMQIADCGSVEGMIAELAEQSSNGVCQVWASQDEFSRVVTGMKKKDYLSDLKDVYMQLYDGKPLSRRLVKTNYRVDPVYMTFISGTTPTRLSSILDASDLEDGFLSRFLLVYARDGGYVDDGEPDPSWSALRKDLEYDLTQVRTAYAAYKTEMFLSKQAAQFFNAWKQDMDSQVRCKQFPPSAAARMEDYFIKMAMLWEVSDACRYLGDKHEITIDRMLFIEDRIRPYQDSMKLMFEKLGVDAKVMLVRNIIEESGTGGVVYRDLLRRSKLSIRKLSECVDTLRAQEVVSCSAESNENGRARIRYFGVGTRAPGDPSDTMSD